MLVGLVGSFHTFEGGYLMLLWDQNKTELCIKKVTATWNHTRARMSCIWKLYKLYFVHFHLVFSTAKLCSVIRCAVYFDCIGSVVNFLFDCYNSSRVSYPMVNYSWFRVISHSSFCWRQTILAHDMPWFMSIIHLCNWFGFQLCCKPIVYLFLADVCYWYTFHRTPAQTALDFNMEYILYAES